MTVTSAELILAAKKTHTNAACEADWRGVCSRAYYCIYEDGKAFHKDLPSPGSLTAESAGGLHGDLIDQLVHPTVPKGTSHTTSKSVGYMMKTLHALRVKSDYKRELDVSAKDAANALAYADSVLKQLNDYAQKSVSGIPVGNSNVSSIAMLNEDSVVVGTTPPKKGGRPTITRIK